MTRKGYDSVDIGAIPDEPDAILLGYVDGRWPTWGSLRRARRNEVILSIAVDPSHTAQMLDVEDKDARADQAPGWAERMRGLGNAYPICYVSAGNGPDQPGPWLDLRKAFFDQKVREPLYAIADYSLGEITDIPQKWVAVGCVGVQYKSDTEKDLDYWVFSEWIPGVDGNPITSQGVDDEMIWGKDGASVIEQIIDGRTAKCREWWLMYHGNREPSVQQLSSAVAFWAGRGGDLAQAAIKDGAFGG